MRRLIFKGLGISHSFSPLGSAAHLPFTAPDQYWRMFDNKVLPFPDTALPIGVPAITLHNSQELRGYTDIPAKGDIAALCKAGKSIPSTTKSNTAAHPKNSCVLSRLPIFLLQKKKLTQTWKNGDKIALRFPMTLSVRTWERNKNSISVNYGPLTYSLLIKENYVQQDSKATAIGDSRWQDGADPAKWPSFEILPASDWNYGLIVDAAHPGASFEVVRKSWPADNNPFTNTNAPIMLKAKGKKIPSWGIDKYGLTGVLPQSPVKTEEAVTSLVLVPMGGARLRISAFPVVM